MNKSKFEKEIKIQHPRVVRKPCIDQNESKIKTTPAALLENATNAMNVHRSHQRKPYAGNSLTTVSGFWDILKKRSHSTYSHPWLIITLAPSFPKIPLSCGFGLWPLPFFLDKNPNIPDGLAFASTNLASAGKVASCLANSDQLPVSPNTTCMPPPCDSLRIPPERLGRVYDCWYGDDGVLLVLGECAWGTERGGPKTGLVFWGGCWEPGCCELGTGGTSVLFDGDSERDDGWDREAALLRFLDRVRVRVALENSSDVCDARVDGLMFCVTGGGELRSPPSLYLNHIISTRANNF